MIAIFGLHPHPQELGGLGARGQVLRTLPRSNSAVVRLVRTDLLTVRGDLED
ncbi:hypothetical protein [Streptomyces bluensis]|uniref:hypothetical protein n=1 Tax=Streptomyces bluensis TaxID=33897 RepID=UPI001676357F|nr:hypothetical protein [Streptomyces bluensis]GGZ75471.1 hypothetical protein GCM10010344_47890 [Streptomyces bluensis]